MAPVGKAPWRTGGELALKWDGPPSVNVDYFLSPMLRGAEIKCKTVYRTCREEEKIQYIYTLHVLAVTEQTSQHCRLLQKALTFCTVWRGVSYEKHTRQHYLPLAGTHKGSNEILSTIQGVTEGIKSNWQSIQKKWAKHESRRNLKTHY